MREVQPVLGVRQLAQISPARVQIQGIDQNTAVGAVGPAHNIEHFVEGAQARQLGELKIDRQAVGRGEVAGLGIDIEDEIAVIPAGGQADMIMCLAPTSPPKAWPARTLGCSRR